jgi:hypothetical protein
MKGEIYNNIISIWIGAWLCPTSTARRWVKVSWFLKTKTKKCCFVCSTRWTRNRYTSPHLRGTTNLKREKKKNGSKSEPLRFVWRHPILVDDGFLSILLLGYILSVDGTRRTNERTSGCRWKTCFCIIRKKEKKESIRNSLTSYFHLRFY